MKTLVILLSIVLSGCSSLSPIQIMQYNESSDPINRTIDITAMFTYEPVVKNAPLFVANRQVVLARAVLFDKEGQKARCFIMSPRPTGPNDKLSNTLLGHELMHCFGAMHE